MATTRIRAQENWTFGATVELVTIECYRCHIVFAMPADLQRRALEDRSTDFWCPQGHSQRYIGETATARLERERRENAARERHLRDQLDASERSTRAYKGQATKLRRRAANGVCPCCTRSFANLKRHMDSQHPGFEVTR